MRLGLSRPRPCSFRRALDASSPSPSSSSLSFSSSSDGNANKESSANANNGDLLKELCSLVASATSKPNAVVSSASSRTKSVRQRYEVLPTCSSSSSSSSSSVATRTRPSTDGFFGHADAILDVIGSVERDRVAAALERYESVVSDSLVARLVLGAQSLEVAKICLDWASAVGHYKPGILVHDCYVQVLVKAGEVGQAYQHFQELRRITSSAPSKFMFGILVDGLATQGESDKAVVIFDEFRRIHSGEDEDEVVQCCSFLVAGLCKAGKIPEATRQYEKLKTSLRFLSVVVYNSLIDGLAKAKMIDKAMEIFRDMDRSLCKPNSHTYGALISGLCKTGRINEACEMLDDMVSRGYVPHVVLYTILIDGLCKAKKFEQACLYLDKVEHPDVVTFSAFIDGLCNAGKVDYAFDLLRQLQESGRARPDVVLYSIFIKGLCKSGQIDAAVDLFRAMEDRGCRPNAVTYNSLMRALAWHRGVDDARRLFAEMIRKGCDPDAGTYVIVSEVFLKSKSLEDARKFEEEVRRIECGSVQGLAAYSSQIEQLCRERNLDEAYRIFAIAARDMEPTVGMYASLVRGFLRERRVAEVDEIIRDMVRRGCAPSSELQSAVMAGLRWNARRGQMPGFVDKLVAEMETKRWIPDALLCSILVEGLCAAGHPRLAQRLVTQIDDQQGIDHHLWDTLVRTLYSCGALGRSLRVAETAVEKGREIHALTYFEIVRGLVRVGKVAKALELFEKMIDHGKPTLTRQMAMVHSSLVTKLCRRGRLQEAYGIHQKMVERGLSPTIKSYKLLIKHQFKAGRIDLCRGLFEQMPQVDSPQSRDTYRILLEGYCAAGMLDEAYGALEAMVARQFKPAGSSYFELVRKLCEMGRTEEAQHILERMVSLGHRPVLRSFNAVFQAYYDAGRFSDARVVFQEVLRLFRSVGGTEFPVTEDQLRVISHQK